MPNSNWPIGLVLFVVHWIELRKQIEEKQTNWATNKQLEANKSKFKKQQQEEEEEKF